MTIAQQIGRAAANLESTARVGAFLNYARCLLASRGDLPAALAFARANRSDERVVEILRSAVSAGSTTDTNWASALAPYEQVAGAFLESLSTASAFQAMLPSMVQLPLHTKIAVVTTGATGAVASQGGTKSVSRLTLAANDLVEKKAVCQVVVTAEIMRLGGPPATQLLRSQLTNAVALETDAEFIRLITTGLTAIPSSGATALAVRADLRGLLQSITTSAASRLYLLMNPVNAEQLAIMADSTGSAAFPDALVGGGSIGGITIAVTDAVTAGTIIAVDAAQIAAASTTITLDASRQADIALNDAPDSPPTASTLLTSLWQHDLAALRATRYFGALRLRDSAVASLSGVAYSGNSPA